MKFTLKEFFFHEAIGDPGDQSARGRGKPPPKPEPVKEKALSSYEHPTTHLAKKFAKQKGVRDPWALAQHVKGQAGVEAVSHRSSGLCEYEDPTSSKHAEDDSKWAGPFSKKERMPHEEPHSGAQERSARGWEEMRSDSDEHYSSRDDLRDFFGGDPYPKSSGKVSEGRKSDREREELEADRYRDSRKDRRATGEPEQPWPVDPRDLDPEDRKSSKVSEAGPRKPGEVISPGHPVKDLPAELPDDWFTDIDAFGTGTPKPDQPADPSGFEPQGEEDIDWSQLDDPEFLDKLASGEEAPPVQTQKPQPKMRDVVRTPEKPYQTFDPEQYGPFTGKVGPEPYAGATEEDMTWDEFRASEPDEAQEAEREFSEEELRGAKFHRMYDGRLYMQAADGKRYSRVSPQAGWVEMDDGQSPAGEF